MHHLVTHICLAMVSNCLQLHLIVASGACSIRIVALPNRLRAITHSGAAGFSLAPITDLKGEVFLSQLNLTEVSKVNNKMGHAALKASGPKRKKNRESCYHKPSERNQVKHVFHPH